MRMVVVLTQVFHQETNHLYGYCLTFLVRKFTKLTYDVCKSVHDDCCREVNEVDEHLFFGGR